ncbi:MAG: hypothetical protein QM664_00480 [Flavihumibacter sp.]
MKDANQYSEAEIQEIYLAYRQCRFFPEKLQLLHQYFGILPAGYPFFDPEGKMFSNAGTLAHLIELLEEERRKVYQPHWHFSFGANEYVFQLPLAAQQFATWNQFVIDAFIQQDHSFRSLFELVENKLASADRMKEMYTRMRNLLTAFADILQKHDVRNFHWQFINVFMRGYNDARQRRMQTLPARKKIIELYLYAQGTMHARLLALLEQKASAGQEWLKKMELVNELGVIDFLRTQFARRDFSSHESRLVEALGVLTGETDKTAVLKYLRDNTLL